MDSWVGFQVPLSAGSVFGRNVSNNNDVDFSLQFAATAQENANTATTSPLGFVNPAGEDFSLPIDAPIYTIYPDFGAADAALFGLYTDEFRSIEAADTSMSRSGNTHCFQFPTKLSERYRLEGSPDLGAWERIGDVLIGTGDGQSIEADIAPADVRRFYRVTSELR